MKAIGGSIVALAGAGIVLAAALAGPGDARFTFALVGLVVTGIGVVGFFIGLSFKD